MFHAYRSGTGTVLEKTPPQGLHRCINKCIKYKFLSKIGYPGIPVLKKESVNCESVNCESL